MNPFASANLSPILQTMSADQISTGWAYLSTLVFIVALVSILLTLYRGQEFGTPGAIWSAALAVALTYILWTGTWCTWFGISQIKAAVFGPGHCGAGSITVSTFWESKSDMASALDRNPEAAQAASGGVGFAPGKPQVNQEPHASWQNPGSPKLVLPTGTFTPLPTPTFTPSPTPTPTPETHLVLTDQKLDPVAEWAKQFVAGGYNQLAKGDLLDRSAVPQGISCSATKAYLIWRGKGAQKWVLTCASDQNGSIATDITSEPVDINVNGFVMEAFGLREGETFTGTGNWEVWSGIVRRELVSPPAPNCSDGNPADRSMLPDGRWTWSCIGRN